MAATKADDEDGEQYANVKSATPSWGADAKNGYHLWIRSSSSGDSCYVGNNGCSAKGQKKRRIKCASCKICVHTECLRTLMGTMKVFCRKTFQDAENGTYREKTDVPHHWVAKRTTKGKCRTCHKNCGGKVCNLLGETIGMSCSWCKEVCHNKDTCFDVNKFSTESCNMGAHSNLIVPATWIVKLPEEESENSKHVFVVKPIPSPKSTPLLVFINPKSGGNQGSRLMRTFQWLLNPRQVFDLTQGGPGLGLELYKRVPNLRILACGGDGTVGWVLSILDKLKLCTAPPVAVLPLGTGNDLARALGWGGGYTDEPIPRILTNIEAGEIVRLDRWILKVTPNESGNGNSGKEEARKDLPLTVVNNYFSLGVDAHVALEFHEAREANPQKFNSRIRNKMFYGQMGGKDLIQRKWKDLSSFVTLECDGQDVTPKLKDLRVHAILFLNINSYGGGTKPWGGSGNQFRTPSTEDGLIEVIGLTTYQLPILQAGGHGSSIAQCRKAKLITNCTVPVQVDGEPCRLLPSIIDIDLLNTVNMIARAKKQGGGIKKESVDISLPLKLIPLSKYESEHQRKSALKDRAFEIGTITITNNTELKEVRSKVKKLLDEKSKETGAKDKNNRCSKITNWWFLDSCSGGKFYRIDEAQEHLFYVNDICDEDLYILEQSDSADENTNDYLKAGPEGDDVSRVSTSSSGRQSLESGEEREAQEEGEYEEGEYEDGEEGEYEEGEYEEGEEGEYEEGEYEEGEYDEGEYDEEDGEEYETGEEPEIPTPDYSFDSGTGIQRTQIIVETAPDMEYDESEGNIENAKDLLSVPEKRSSITSLTIDESEMDIITAAKFGNLNRIAELHNAGYSVSDKDHEGRTALHHAAFIGNIDVVRYLAAYVPIGVLDARDDMMYQTALHRAALRGDRKVCSVLVSAGASLDIRDKEGCTAQDLAAAIGDKNLAKYLETMATPVIL